MSSQSPEAGLFSIARHLDVASLTGPFRATHAQAMEDLVANGEQLGMRITPLPIDELRLTLLGVGTLFSYSKTRTPSTNLGTIRDQLANVLPDSHNTPSHATIETIAIRSRKASPPAVGMLRVFSLVMKTHAVVWREYNAILAELSRGTPLAAERKNLFVDVATSASRIPRPARVGERRLRGTMQALRGRNVPLLHVSFDDA